MEIHFLYERGQIPFSLTSGASMNNRRSSRVCWCPNDFVIPLFYGVWSSCLAYPLNLEEVAVVTWLHKAAAGSVFTQLSVSLPPVSFFIQAGN
jgi:hypothetical protein